jgi:tRNA-binding EMAP/Myf-like protein
MKDKISFEEFLAIQEKLEIKVGVINAAERVPKSYGLKLTVDFGDGDVRSVFTNLGKTHEPNMLVGLTMPFVVNLEPVKIKGVDSEAMILVGLTPDGQEEVGMNFLSAGSTIF